jgi:hypothetical protein
VPGRVEFASDVVVSQPWLNKSFEGLIVWKKVQVAKAQGGYRNTSSTQAPDQDPAKHNTITHLSHTITQPQFNQYFR